MAVVNKSRKLLSCDCNSYILLVMHASPSRQSVAYISTILIEINLYEHISFIYGHTFYTVIDDVIVNGAVHYFFLLAGI